MQPGRSGGGSGTTTKRNERCVSLFKAPILMYTQRTPGIFRKLDYPVRIRSPLEACDINIKDVPVIETYFKFFRDDALKLCIFAVSLLYY